MEMLKMKDSVDFSSYMLFEATGDSEADVDPIVDEIAYEISRDDDDAQSCSYDRSENCINIGDEIKEFDSCCVDNEKKEDNDDGEEVGVYGISYCEDDEIQNYQKSVVDPGKESLDEMEKNRQFWEACLAS